MGTSTASIGEESYEPPGWWKKYSKIQMLMTADLLDGTSIATRANAEVDREI